MGDPCVDPPHRIRDIGTVDGDFITDKKILRDILLDPSSKSMLLLNRPPTISHLPDLKGRFLGGLCKRGD
jgi:hypothetical protein